MNVMGKNVLMSTILQSVMVHVVSKTVWCLSGQNGALVLPSVALESGKSMKDPLVHF